MGARTYNPETCRAEFRNWVRTDIDTATIITAEHLYGDRFTIVTGIDDAVVIARGCHFEVDTFEPEVAQTPDELTNQFVAAASYWLVNES